MQKCFLRGKRRERTRKLYGRMFQNVGNGIIVNAKSYLKKYSLNQMLRGNVAFAFYKCLFSTHFLLRKS